MVFKYFFARLKRNIGLMIVGSLALFLVCITLITAIALPNILNDILLVYSKQICGNADIMLTNSLDTEDRFFGLTALRSDNILAENSEYINGYFMALAELQYNKKAFQCTVMAAKYERQQQYNPIKSVNLPDEITDSDVIVGAKYAYENGINIGDEVKIIFMEKEIFFRVAAIAENEGLFFSGNTVFISSYALSRFNSFFGSELVTHCFIKADNTESLTIIQEHLKQEYNDLDFKETTKLNDKIYSQTVTSLILITAIVIIFCILTLTVLLKIIFGRERANFKLLRALGMSEVRITTISLLTSFLMCSLAFLSGVATMFSLERLIRSASPLYSNIKIGIVPLIIGILGSLVISLICTIFGIREKEKTKVKIKTKESKKISNGTVFIISGILAAVSIPILSFSPYLGLITAAAGLVCYIAFMPKAAAKFYDKLFHINKNINSLRLKNLTKKHDWQKFLLFTTLCIIVIVLILLTIANMRSAIAGAMINQIDIKNKGEIVGKVQSVSNNLALYFFSDFIWLIDIFCWSLIFLAAITAILIIVMRRLTFQEETQKLIPLGLTKKAEVTQNLSAIIFAILPVIISMPFLIFLISFGCRKLFILIGSGAQIKYDFLTVLLASIVSFIFIVVVEILVCLYIWRKNNKTKNILKNLR